MIARKYASRPDLRDQPIPDPDLVLMVAWEEGLRGKPEPRKTRRVYTQLDKGPETPGTPMS